MTAPSASTGLCEVFNLGSGRGISVLELVAAFKKACGKEIPYKCALRADPCLMAEGVCSELLHGDRAMLPSTSPIPPRPTASSSGAQSLASIACAPTRGAGSLAIRMATEQRTARIDG